MKNLKKSMVIISAVLVLSILLTACGEDKVKGSSKQLDDPVEGEEVAIIKTNMGDVKLRLFPEVAPKAVENFIKHSKDGYYDGVVFHRVIENFMIQTGDPDGTGMGGESIWDADFEDEFDEDFRNYRGALSMANAGPNTNGSQFFIVQAEDKEDIDSLIELGKQEGVEFSDEVMENYKKLGGTPWLDFKHTVFGQVYEGMDIVDKIAEVEVNEMDRPLEDIIIENIEIIKYK